MKLKDYKNIILYTSASPRVGNEAFAEYIDSNVSRHIRLVNKADIVPQLPPPLSPNFKNPSKPWIYSHSGKEETFSKNTGSVKWNHELPIYLDYLTS